MGSSSPGDERRGEPRTRLSLKVSYGDRAAYLHDWTENISARGLFVESDEERTVGEPVQLRIEFPALLEPVDVSGVVSWSRPKSALERGGFGLRVDGELARRRLAELALLASLEPGGDVVPFRILVAEDNDQVVAMYDRVLRRVDQVTEGSLQVEIAANGHEAWDRLQAQGADLLITDLYMPILDGFALCERIRADDALGRMPILVVTSGTSDERERAINIGVDAFLHKPVRFGQILETIAILTRRGSIDGQKRQQGSEGGEADR
ncbi:MAG: response regulator [Myxococcota bacterium]